MHKETELLFALEQAEGWSNGSLSQVHEMYGGDFYVVRMRARSAIARATALLGPADP